MGMRKKGRKIGISLQFGLCVYSTEGLSSAVLLSHVLGLTAWFLNPGTARALPKALREMKELGSI